MKHKPLGNYKVFENGDIVSKYGWRGKVENKITPITDDFGYKCVRLVIDGKRKKWKLHKLIAELFLKAPKDPKAMVCHKDGDKNNNAAANLYFGDAKTNARDRDLHGRTSRGHFHSLKVRQGIETSKANAKLIAAAPEMLECLEALVNALKLENKKAYEIPYIDKVALAANILIKKAKGE